MSEKTKRDLLEMLAGATNDVEREMLEELLERTLRLEQIDEELTRMSKDMTRLERGDDDPVPDKGTRH